MQKAKLTEIQAQLYNLSRAPEEEQGIRMREIGSPLTVLLPVYEIKRLNKVLHASEPSLEAKAGAPGIPGQPLNKSSKRKNKKNQQRNRSPLS